MDTSLKKMLKKSFKNMKCNLDKVVSISGGLGEPPAVGGFQKVSPAKDRRHCKSVRMTFHGKVGSEERGNGDNNGKEQAIGGKNG